MMLKADELCINVNFQGLILRHSELDEQMNVYIVCFQGHACVPRELEVDNILIHTPAYILITHNTNYLESGRVILA